MEYECVMKQGTGKSTWHSSISLLAAGNGQYEAVVNGRGTYFHIIAGKYKYGNYLCIPNHDVGCELSEFTDLFWNTERLSGLLGRKVDAVTVATGLCCLEKLISSKQEGEQT